MIMELYSWGSIGEKWIIGGNEVKKLRLICWMYICVDFEVIVSDGISVREDRER